MSPCASARTLRDGTQLTEAITGDGAAIFRHACWMDLEGIVSKAPRLALRQRAHDELAEDEEPGFQEAMTTANFSTAVPTSPMRTNTGAMGLLQPRQGSLPQGFYG